jgi:hypothetical protein
MVSRAHHGREPGALPDQPSQESLPHDSQFARAPGPSESPCAVGTMNDALDLHEITTVVPVALDESGNGADERGWWPVLAFTEEGHPIVLECNVN